MLEDLRDLVSRLRSDLGETRFGDYAERYESTVIRVSGRMKALEKHSSSSVKILGLVSFILGIMLLVMTVYSAAVGEDTHPFLYPAPFFLLIGMFMYVRFSYSHLTAAIGILMVTEAWMLCFVAAIIPFVMSGVPVIDAVYEGVSGFTTTGSTMIDVSMFLGGETSVLLWRSVIEWVGGITVVIVFATLLPMIGMGAKNLASNELSSGSDHYSEDVRTSAMGFIRMYVLLTVIEVIILNVLSLMGIDSDKLTVFNSVCIAMSNVSTGGLLPFPDSMAGVGFQTQFVTFVFMILGASNFFIMLRSVALRRFTLHLSREWTMMIVWFAICAAAIFVALFYDENSGVTSLSSLWEVLYAVVSAGTSAGFAVTTYATWPIVAIVMLMIVQFVGGCSGSTSGGIKVYRLMAIKAFIAAGMQKVMHPGAVTVMEVDGSKLDADQSTSVLSTVLLFLFGLLMGTVLLLALENIGLRDALILAVSAITNSGAVLGTGALDFEISSLSKLLLCVLMYLGRMEMVYILIMFTTGFWKDVIQSTKRRARRKRSRNDY